MWRSEIWTSPSRRSSITSRAWRCRATWRGSWSRVCSRIQITPSCWWAEETLPEVCSSRSPSAQPQTCSNPNQSFTNQIRPAPENSQLTCPKCPPRHLSGQYCSSLMCKMIYIMSHAFKGYTNNQEYSAWFGCEDTRWFLDCPHKISVLIEGV